MKLMDLDEVAEFLRIEKRTLHNWLSMGKLPRNELTFCPPGTRTRLFVREKLEAWVEEQIENQMKVKTKRKITCG